VEDRTIEPNPCGVTVIEGPNEIGKSSLAEAIDLIFEHMDTTSKREVRSAQPADRDVGPEIEVDVETGPYRFTYFKRFLKRQETTLTVTAPKPESSTGREAHDRVRAILSETMDTNLWKALCVVQGASVAQADLTNAASLSEALDRAAGGEVAGERERTVYDAIHQEFSLYFTDGDSERKPLSDARQATKAAAAEVERMERELQSINDLVQRSARLENDVTELASQVDEARKNMERRQGEREDVERQEEHVRGIEETCQRAIDAEKRASKDAADRDALMERVKLAEKIVADLQKQAAESQPTLEAARETEDLLRSKLQQATESAKRASELVTVLAGDIDFHKDKLDLDLLSERRQKIDSWQSKKAAATDLLEHNQATDKLLNRLKTLSRDLDRAEAQLDAGSPKLLVKALDDISLEIDGKRLDLAKGKHHEASVGERVKLRIPHVAVVEVSAGTSLDEIVQRRDALREKVSEALEQAGVASVEEAERANLAQRDAERVVDDAVAAIKDNLRDLTFEEMLGKIERLTSKIETYPRSRSAGLAMPKNLDHARAEKKDAEAAAELAEKSMKALQAKHDAADKLYRELHERAQSRSVELRVEMKTLDERRSELAVARDHSSDAAITRAAEDAKSEARNSRHVLQEARRELDGRDPARIRELAENATTSCRRMSETLRRREDEKNGVVANLELLGEQGIYESLEDARSRLDHAEREHASVLAKAAAAAILWKTMKRKRDEARRAYAAPLRDSIIRLGRYIFDGSFTVELDETLAIVQRTLGGKTLPFDSLSVGAKEQLGLMTRLACSQIVDPDDGVPLIFDDTLGHTDPDRLEGMGAMLSHAGSRSQIIVLTCTPGRFRHIGAARTISLAG